MRAPFTSRPCGCDGAAFGPVRDPFRPNRQTFPAVISATRSRRTLPIAGSTATPIFYPNGSTSFREQLRGQRANWNKTRTAQEFDGSYATRNPTAAPVADNAFTRFTRQVVDAFGTRPGIPTNPQRGK